MGLTIDSSSSVEILTQGIAQRLNENTDIFTPKFIVTSNSGINNWLKITLAEKNGIAANLSFIKNDDLIRIAYSILSEDKKESLSSPKLQWHIYSVLGSDNFKTKFKEKYNYFKDDELKKYGLSKKLAELIDKYQMYIVDELTDDKDWQIYIWKQVKINISDEIITREDIKKTIINELKKPIKQELLKSKIPSVNIFLSIEFTPYHIEIYKILSEFIDIIVYLFNPYNESNKPNSLVDSWGGVIQNTLKLLPNFNALQFKKENNRETLLAKIQNDILQSNKSSNLNFSELELNDGSIIINSIYTPMREVEVLYNYLLKNISESNNTIGSRDILVMAPDINIYAPAIKGVFDSANIKLPYSISDTTYETTNSILNAIEAILLLDDNYKVESIIQLLEYSYIKNKYQIKDIELIRSLVSAANIKFGKEGDKNIETNTVSWIHGLKRLIYGFCLSGEFWYSDKDDNYLLLDLVEGSDVSELLKLHKFFEDIVEFTEDRCSKSLEGWTNYLNELIFRFTIDEDEQNHDIAFLQKHVFQISSPIHNSDENIEYRVFKKYVLDIILDISGKSNFATKGITFCSMNQMRNVPYKIVAVLGLNLNDFPRKETKLSFDLLKDNSLISSINDTDNFLFLQNFLSAKDKLYLSYNGRSIKDNSVIPPSSIIDDLLDYINENVVDEKYIKEFVCEHPLHSFSQKYFDKTDNRYYTYLFDKNKNKIDYKDEPKRTDDITEIDIKDLKNFFKNPFKYFYNHTLGIYYSESNDLLDETEMFELGNLEQWSVKTDLLHSETDIESLRKLKVEKGELPLKNYGAVLLDDLNNEILKLKNKFYKCRGVSTETQESINIVINNITIKGKVHNIYGGKYIFTTVSKDTSIAKYFLEVYINHLLLRAAGINKDCYFLSISENYDRKNILSDLSQKEANDKLRILIEMFKKGQDEILPFTIELNWERGTKKINELSNNDIKDEIKKHVNSDYSFPSEELKIETNSNYFNTVKVEELKKNTKEILTDLVDIF